MGLSIKITSKNPKKIHNVLAYTGKITIGDFSESLYIPLDLWSIEEYLQQWQEGLARIKTHRTSCLIATIHDPKIRRYIDWWVMYRIEDNIYIQNQRLMYDIYDDNIGNKEFTRETCYDFIKPREILSESGREISEWSVSLSDVFNV